MVRNPAHRCLCCWARPFIPPFEGLEKAEKKFTFMTLDDALALEAAVNENSNVLIIGAGLIGLKCAEGLHDRAAGITVCDLAGHVLSSILDTDCAVLMQKHLEANGIQFILGDTVCRFEKNSAVMKSGKTVNFDVLVLAVGVRANISLVKDIGGEVNRGIIVNDRLETSIAGVCCRRLHGGEDISAPGKSACASAKCLYAGPRSRSEHGRW